MSKLDHARNGIYPDGTFVPCTRLDTVARKANNVPTNCKVLNNSTVYQSGYSLQSVGDYDPGFSPSLFFAKVLTGKTSSFQNPFLVS